MSRNSKVVPVQCKNATPQREAHDSRELISLQPEQATDGVDFCKKLRQVLQDVEIEELLEPNAWRPG